MSPPVLCLALCLALVAPAAAQPQELPEDWVAQCAGNVLTARQLGRVVVGREMQNLLQPGSSASTVLRQLAEKRVVLQEARVLGIQVSDAQVNQRYRELAEAVRIQTNGHKTLEQEIRDQKTTQREFRALLHYQLVKEAIAGHDKYLGDTLPASGQARIAQTEVVIAKIVEAARIDYGFPTAFQDEPTRMARNLVATVNGEGITIEDFGEALLVSLDVSRIKEIIVEECKAVLTRSVALTVEEMEPVIQKERERWLKQRELATQEAMRHLSYEDYVKLRYGLDLEQLKNDRYFRGVYGLLRRFKDQVAPAEPFQDANGNGRYDPGERFTDVDGNGTWDPDEVTREYEANRESLYGESILVSDIQIAFESGSALVPGRGGRDHREALRMAHELLRRNAAGVPWEQITREVNARQVNGGPDPTFRARRIRVRNTGNETILYERAQAMDDGDVSSPFETLAEVHVFRRLRRIPAPGFDEVQEMIRERLAARKAGVWFDEQLSDESLVQVRWPLPE
jgi:hypothetical protein